jgi:uncharacterized membrane protein
MTTTRPLTTAGSLLGIGLGGFFDGILFHQILQLHNTLSHWIPPTTVVNLEINMFWDGLFHALTWTTTVIGLLLLWRAVRRDDVALSNFSLGGSMLFGWGLFNLVEGTIDHQILQVHHVMYGEHQVVADLAFLASGVLFITVGWYLMHLAHGRPQTPVVHDAHLKPSQQI